MWRRCWDRPGEAMPKANERPGRTDAGLSASAFSCALAYEPKLLGCLAVSELWIPAL